MIMLQANGRRFHRVTLLGLAVLWLLTVGVPGVTADDDESFSNRSLRGAYGLIASGTLFGDPTIAVGRITFDGKGTCGLVVTVNIAAAGGTGPTVATVCTYAVQTDGTGTFTAVVPGLGTFNNAFVIVDNRKEVHMITLDPGVSATTLLKKQ
jgi:hypothetical protein